MLRKTLSMVTMAAVLGSSLYGAADAYFAHFDNKAETLTKVDKSQNFIDENDEVIVIEKERIYLLDRSVENSATPQRKDTGMHMQSCYTNYSKSKLEAGYFSNYKTCRSMFMSWHGDTFTTMANTVLGWTPIANVAITVFSLPLVVLDLGGGTYPFQNGLMYFSAIDSSKFEKVVEENDLKSYQLKLLTGTGN